MEVEGNQQSTDNAANGNVDLTPEKDGGVLKLIKKEGSGEEFPGQGDTVIVHYTGTLTDGSKFDSSRDRGEKFEFELGKGSVIKAWDIGVATMKRGEVCVLTCQAKYAYGESGSPPKIPPNATLIFEVELFDWRGEDLSEDRDGGVTRQVLKKGEHFTSPNDGATCNIHIVGKYKNAVFEDRDVELVLGEGSECNVVPGVEQALKHFKKNEKSKLLIEAKYAYGSDGHKEYGIPGGASLEYEVELKTFEKAKEAWEMDAKEKLEQSDIVKSKGTNYFKAGKYKLANKYYKKINDYLEHETDLEGEEAKNRNTLLLASHLNQAMCLLKLNEDLKAIKECDKALELDDKNVKGLFRRGQAHFNMQDNELALGDFKKVLEIDPQNKAARNQLAIVNKKIKEQKDKERKLYSGMFSKFADQDGKKKRQETERENAQSGLKNIGDWTNKMADDFMPLDQEAEAFGEKMPEAEYNKNNKDI